MPLKLVDLIRRYVVRFVLLPAIAVTIIGAIIGASLAVRLEQGAEKKLLAANGKNLEQLILSGDSVGLDRQLRAISSSRQWTEAYVLDPQSRVIASYPESNNIGELGASLRCSHSQDFKSTWDTNVGRLCWEANRFRMATPTIVVFLCVMGMIIWTQASLGVFLGRLVSRHAKSLTELAELFSRSRPLTSEDLSDMPHETLEAAQLLEAIRQFISIEKKLKDSEVESEKQRALSAIATQVAHDVRSPLAALDSVVRDSYELPEDRRQLVIGAVNRIQDIANDLLRRNHFPNAGEPPTPEPQLLWRLVEPLLKEKRLQFRGMAGIDIQGRFDEGRDISSCVVAVEFKRILSNLINNAVEAIKDGAGTVSVSLEATDGQTRLSVKDDGAGIPPQILAKLGQRGETHGKSGGSGLGLYHAKTCAEEWGGRLEIESHIGLGTTVTLLFPLAITHEWVAPDYKDAITPGRERLDAILIDDDPLVRMTWKTAAARAGKNYRGFASVAEFFAAVGSIDRTTAIYIDAELGDEVRGDRESVKIHGLGFGEIYLATGHPPEAFASLKHLRGVVGKETPWG